MFVCVRLDGGAGEKGKGERERDREKRHCSMFKKCNAYCVYIGKTIAANRRVTILALSSRLLFYSDAGGKTPRVSKSNLDGSSATTILDHGITSPSALRYTACLL